MERWHRRIHAHIQPGRKSAVARLVGHNYMGNPPTLWDVANGTEIARLAGHKSDTQPQGVTFSHDGRRIATVSLDGSARIWDGKSGILLDVLGQEVPELETE